MPFKRKVSIIPFCCTGYIEKVPTEVGGKVVYKDLDLSKVHNLGKAEDFDLGKMLDSGVDLKQVNPMVLGRHVSSDQLDNMIEDITNFKPENEGDK